MGQERMELTDKQIEDWRGITDGFMDPKAKEEFNAVIDLAVALLSLTAMEGEGVEVPELMWWHDDAEQVIVSGLKGDLTITQSIEVIRRNNAEPVLRALVKLMDEQVRLEEELRLEAAHDLTDSGVLERLTEVRMKLKAIRAQGVK